jgi:hypothetical protein
LKGAEADATWVVGTGDRAVVNDMVKQLASEELRANRNRHRTKDGVLPGQSVVLLFLKGRRN